MATAYYFVDSATCLANASGFATLCQALNKKGLITDQEFEDIRHEHLHQIDKVFGEMRLPGLIAELLEQRREAIELFWHVGADEQSRRAPVT